MATLGYNYGGDGSGGDGDRWNPWKPRQPVEKPMLELETSDFDPITVLVFGHSFIWRLNRYLVDSFGPNHNLEFEFNIANVFFYSIGGMPVDQARVEELGIVLYYRPQLVYIEMGTNELCDYYYTPDVVGREIQNLVEDMLSLGVREVIVGEVIFRNPRGIPRQMNDYNERVLQLNQYMEVFINSTFTPRGMLWRHRGLWNSIFPTLQHDGTHLNMYGLYRYYRSVRGAIMQGLRRLHRRWYWTGSF